MVVALCFLTIVFDGYDLIVYGSVVPSLHPRVVAVPGAGRRDRQLRARRDADRCTGAGPLTDRFGRRRLMLAGITWFSLAMLAVRGGAGPGALGLLRFVAGLGLGG